MGGTEVRGEMESREVAGGIKKEHDNQEDQEDQEDQDITSGELRLTSSSLTAA